MKFKGISVIFVLVLVFSINKYLNLFLTELEFIDQTLDIKLKHKNYNKKSLKKSEYWDEYTVSFIHITGANWTLTNNTYSWCNGSGTKEFPFIIENIRVDGDNSGTCIFINDSNVYFVIQNCTIFNSGEEYSTKDSGIKLENTTNGTIYKNTIYNTHSGIHLYNSSFNYVSENTANFNTFGVYLEESNKNNITLNIFNNNTYDGIYFRKYCNNNTVSENRFSNNSIGIYLWYSENNTIRNNILRNNNHGIFIASSNTNFIDRNNASNNNWAGIYIGTSKEITLKNNNMIDCGVWLRCEMIEEATSHIIDKSNRVNGKPLYYYANEEMLIQNNFSNGGQVILANCNNCLITNLNISRGTNGISLFYCNNITIKNCSASYNINNGIYLWYCENNALIGNNVSHTRETAIGNPGGIYLDYCYSNNISENIMTNNKGSGLVLRDCNNNSISRNIGTFNDRNGITVYKGKNNTILENNASYNFEYGIYVSASDNNLINDNNATNNLISGIQVVGDCNNISENIADNNKFYGIDISGSQNNLSQNEMKNCGIQIGYSSLEEISSNKLDNSNKVNGKLVFYYVNQTYLGNDNFTNAGQVILVNCNDSIISNLDVSFGSTGILLYFCCNNTVSNNNISYNLVNGLYLRSCINNTILNNNASNIYGEFDITPKGIGLANSHGNNISENIVSGSCYSGIDLFFSDNNTIVKNNVSDNNVGILISHSVNHTLIENKLIDCGVVVYSQEIEMLNSHHIDTSNIVNGKALYYYVNQTYLGKDSFSNAGQVILVNCNDSTVSNLNLSNCTNGLSLCFCRNITVTNITIESNSYMGLDIFSTNCSCFSNNTISNNYWGIVIRNGLHNNITKSLIKENLQSGIELYLSKFSNVSYNIIKNNSLSGVEYSFSCLNDTIYNNTISYNGLNGITVYSSNNITVFQNRVFNNNEHGILLNGEYYRVKNNSIVENVVHNNNFDGIRIIHSSFTAIYKNKISNNLQKGIYVDSECNLNTFYLNYFMQNGIHAVDKGLNNNWNSSTIGNYWDDYIGEDINPRDGIGDTPYYFEGGVDYLPIWLEFAPIILINFPVNNSVFGRSAPNFEIEVVTSTLDTLWYTLNDGLINKTFNKNETIDQTLWENAWDSLYEGEYIIIRFYANNSYGNISYIDLRFIKGVIPIITIITPALHALFNRNAPSFTVEINETNLDSLWYSLDGGLTNKIFSTNGTIDQILWENAWDSATEGDYITIRFYANDTLRLVGYSDIEVVKVAPPIITIINPINNAKINRTAPEFIVEIYDPNLDSFWYSLDGGLTKVFFTTNGTINQTLWENMWDSLSIGDIITITFYANDTFEQINYEEVKVVKYIYRLPIERQILIISLIIGTICSLSLVFIIFLKKRSKV